MIEDYSASIRRVYSECVDRLIANIARHFPHAALDLGSTFDWETAKLAELGQLRRENLAIIAQTAGDTSGMTEIALEKAMTDALKRGAPELLAAVNAGMLDAVAPAELSTSMQGILKYYSSQAAIQTNLVNTVMLTDSLNGFRRVVARTVAAQNVLRDVAQGALNTATGQVLSGISSLQAAVRDALRQMAQEGIKGFVDKSGRSWSPDAYAEMDIRTTAGNVAREAVFQQNTEFGVDTVIVPVHAVARPGCAPFQGWVISMSNQSGYTTDASGNQIRVHAVRETTYGQAAGLWGINCSHQPDPFIPGWSESKRPIEAGEVSDRYEETQKQRYHEREVKQWKRAAVAAEASGDKDAFLAASAKVKEKTEALKAYCEKTGLPFSSDRMQVFGYNRSDGGKATQALRGTHKATLGEEERIRAVIRSDTTPKTINIGNQNKHIQGSKGYIAGRSYLYGTLEDAQGFVDQYHGTGEILFDRKGNWKNREIVTVDHDIGVCLDVDGASEVTNAVVIHYGKKGTHIVPAARREYR